MATTKSNTRGCDEPDDPIIFPGGGDCGNPDPPCLGPDCPDPGTGDDPCLQLNPPSDCNPYPCAINCPDDLCGVELQQCTGPDCVNPADHPELDHLDLSYFEGYCLGMDCTYIDGKFHVYRHCSWACAHPDECPSSELERGDGGDCNVGISGGSIVGVTLNFYTMTAPPSFISGGITTINKYKHYVGSEEHYRLSSQEMGRTIEGGDGFYPARHGVHEWTYEGDSNASTVTHPWNFTGARIGTWSVHSLYGGLLNSVTNFNGQPVGSNILRTAMIKKTDIDRVYVYMGKMHCQPPTYHRAFPFAVSSPGVLTANTDFLLTTGGKLTHMQSTVRDRNWKWHFPMAYDLTNTCDSGNMCYEECMREDINGNPVKPNLLMPGGGPHNHPTVIGTYECEVTGEEVVDCMDPSAFNYNPLATDPCENNCCCYIQGCTDPTAYNYNTSACHDDGSCCYIAGCMDVAACNYVDVGQCYDDGSCCYVLGCTDPLAGNYNENACCDNGTCIVENA